MSGKRRRIKGVFPPIDGRICIPEICIPRCRTDSYLRSQFTVLPAGCIHPSFHSVQPLGTRHHSAFILIIRLVLLLVLVLFPVLYSTSPLDCELLNYSIASVSGHHRSLRLRLQRASFSIIQHHPSALPSPPRPRLESCQLRDRGPRPCATIFYNNKVRLP